MLHKLSLTYSVSPCFITKSTQFATNPELSQNDLVILLWDTQTPFFHHHGYLTPRKPLDLAHLNETEFQAWWLESTNYDTLKTR